MIQKGQNIYILFIYIIKKINLMFQHMFT